MVDGTERHPEPRKLLSRSPPKKHLPHTVALCLPFIPGSLLVSRRIFRADGVKGSPLHPLQVTRGSRLRCLGQVAATIYRNVRSRAAGCRTDAPWIEGIPAGGSPAEVQPRRGIHRQVPRHAGLGGTRSLPPQRLPGFFIHHGDGFPRHRRQVVRVPEILMLVGFPVPVDLFPGQL